MRLTADSERYLTKVSGALATLQEAGIPDLIPRGHRWLDSVPAMLAPPNTGSASRWRWRR